MRGEAVPTHGRILDGESQDVAILPVLRPLHKSKTIHEMSKNEQSIRAVHR
jgi:hypothetical protein